MGATPFRHLDFVPHEPVTKEKMDQFQSNVQWIVDNTPTSLYTDHTGFLSTQNIILVGGKSVIPLSYGKGTASVTFNGAFASNTTPQVSIGILTDQHKRVFCTMNGIGSSILPDARGFEISASLQDYATLVNPYPAVAVHWIAMGLRSADYERI